MEGVRSWIRGVIVLSVAMLAVGTVAITPSSTAVDGLSKRERKQGDNRWYNVGEKVAEANMLDGLDSTDFVRKAETFTRNWSCAGVDWDPQAPTDVVVSSQTGRSSLNLATVRCSVSIPDGAIVTATHFGVQDSDLSRAITCSMWRTAFSVAGGPTQMAQASTAPPDQIPGITRISDTSIAHPIIDNVNNAYFLECFLGDFSAIEILGGTVTYMITGGQGGG